MAGTASVHTERVVTGEVAHGQVVHVYMFTGLDRLAGETNDLAVSTQRLTGVDGPGRNFVSRGNRVQCDKAFDRQLQPFGQRLAGNQYIVERVKTDHGVGNVFPACFSYQLHHGYLNKGSKLTPDRVRGSR